MKCKCPKCGFQYNRRDFNDKKLRSFCKNKGRSITEIAKHLGIAIKNVSIRVRRMEKEGFIVVDRMGGRGKSYSIKTIK